MTETAGLLSGGSSRASAARNVFAAKTEGPFPGDGFKSYANPLRPHQLGLRLETSALVDASNGCGDSAAKLGSERLATDMAFSDGLSPQLATLTASVRAGYAASLTVAS
ncbi:MAG: hypothetical protein JO369_08530 [Paucibacter sp.]|nr:hypothetical protein [Roseateles sp.]